MDRTPIGANNLNEAVWTVDLSSADDWTLEFFHADFNDEQHVLPADWVGHANGDGVAISDDGVANSDDGVRWHRVLNATNVQGWQPVSIDLGAEAAAVGMTLGAGFQIKFQQFDNFPLTTDGRGYDETTISREADTSDLREACELGTDPCEADTDGVGDGDELLAGTDPLDPESL